MKVFFAIIISFSLVGECYMSMAQDITIPGWYDESRYQIHNRFNLGWSNSIDHADFFNAASLISNMGIKAHTRHIKSGDEGAIWESSVGLIHPLVQTHGNLAKTIIDSSHNNGLSIICYYRHFEDSYVIAENPEWQCRSRTGELITKRGPWVSFATPYIDFLSLRLQELLDLGADGFYFDEIHIPRDGDFSIHSRELFYERYNMDMLEATPGQVEIFRQEVINSTFNKLRKDLQEKKSDIVLLLSANRVKLKTLKDFYVKWEPHYWVNSPGFVSIPIAATILRDASGGKPTHCWFNSLAFKHIPLHEAARYLAYNVIFNRDIQEDELSETSRWLINQDYKPQILLADKISPYIAGCMPYNSVLIHIDENHVTRVDPLAEEFVQTFSFFRKEKVSIGTVTESQIIDGIPESCNILCFPLWDSIPEVLMKSVECFISSGGKVLLKNDMQEEYIHSICNESNGILITGGGDDIDVVVYKKKSSENLLVFVTNGPQNHLTIEMDSTTFPAYAYEVITGKEVPVISDNGNAKIYLNGFDVMAAVEIVCDPVGNAKLSSITWPDKPYLLVGWKQDTIPGFDPEVRSYNITLPYNIEDVPALYVTTQSMNAKARIFPALNLNGIKEERTARISVIAGDDSTEINYYVTFSREQSSDLIQSWEAEPFISEIIYCAPTGGADAWLEIYNPGTEPVDLSNYMFSVSQRDPPTTITGIISHISSDYTARYGVGSAYIPGFKWPVTKQLWDLTPGHVIYDSIVNPILEPGDVWILGQNQHANTLSDDPVTQLADVVFMARNRWGEIDATSGFFQQFFFQPRGVYIWKILNDSIRQGMKAIKDTIDFKLVERWGIRKDSLTIIAGRSLASLSPGKTIIRKPHIATPGTEPTRGWGTNSEDSDWVVLVRGDEYDGNPLNTNRDICFDLGKHDVDDLTNLYISTVTSSVYKVEEGYHGNLHIRWVSKGENVETFMNNLIKAHTGQTLRIYGPDGTSVKELVESVAEGDLLTVTAALGKNQTRYIISTSGPDENNTLILEEGSELEIFREGDLGTISGFPFGTSVKSIINQIIKPDLSVLRIINNNGEMLPLTIINTDRIKTTVTADNQVYFKVIAENGNSALYQLQPSSMDSDAYVLSDIYMISQEETEIRSVPEGTSVSAFYSGLKAVPGASMQLKDNKGEVKIAGILAADDLLYVYSQNFNVTKIYKISFFKYSFQLSFSFLNKESGDPIEDAEIRINGIKYSSDYNGKVEIQSTKKFAFFNLEFKNPFFEVLERNNIFISSDSSLVFYIPPLKFYPVRLEFFDSFTREPVQNLEVSFSGESHYTDSMGIIFMPAMLKGKYDLTFPGQKYEMPGSGIIEINSDSVITIMVDRMLDLSLKVINKTSGSPIFRALLQVDNNFYYTDLSGLIEIGRYSSGYLLVNLEHTDYFNLFDTLLISTDTIFIVYMNPAKANVTFRVADVIGPLDEVKVEMKDFFQFTNKEGNAFFNFLPAREEYLYRIERNEYIPMEGILYLEQDTTLVIMLNRFTSYNNLEPYRFIVHPNPFDSYIQIQTQQLTNIYLYDISGLLRQCMEFEQGINTISTDALEKGVYLLRMMDGNGIYNKMMIK